MVAARLKYHGVRRRGPVASSRTILAAQLRKQTVWWAQNGMNMNAGCRGTRPLESRDTSSGRLSHYLVAGDNMTPALHAAIL